MAQTMLPNNYSARLDIERMFAAAQNIAADGQNSGKVFFLLFWPKVNNHATFAV